MKFWVKPRSVADFVFTVCGCVTFFIPPGVFKCYLLEILSWKEDAKLKNVSLYHLWTKRTEGK